MQTAQVTDFSPGPYWQLRLCKDGDLKPVMVTLFSLVLSLSLSLCVCVLACACVIHSVVSGSLQPHSPGRTVACQDPLSMEFFWQEHWSELPFPTLGDHPCVQI